MRHPMYTIGLLDVQLRTSSNIYLFCSIWRLTMTFAWGGQTYKPPGVKFSQDSVCQQYC